MPGTEAAMVNLLDMMRQAQSGAWLETLGQPYGLSAVQSRHAVESLMPAFSMALEHATRNPDGFAQLIEMMSSAQYLPFFERSIGGANGGRAGTEIVSRLFGADETSRKVAEQASAMTGIATGVLHRMMPTVAAVMMGGLVRSLSVDGLSDVLRSWADWLAKLKQPERRPEGDLGAFYKAWGDNVATMMGVGPKPPPPPPPPADPWSGMMQAMFPAAKPAPPPPPATPNPFEALAKLFDTGRDVQAQYLASLQGVLDQAWGTPAPKR